jgi:hypothetical protein
MSKTLEAVVFCTHVSFALFNFVWVYVSIERGSKAEVI